jgi:hypothetical protein
MFSYKSTHLLSTPSSYRTSTSSPTNNYTRKFSYSLHYLEHRGASSSGFLDSDHDHGCLQWGPYSRYRRYYPAPMQLDRTQDQGSTPSEGGANPTRRHDHQVLQLPLKAHLARRIRRRPRTYVSTYLSSFYPRLALTPAGNLAFVCEHHFATKLDINALNDAKVVLTKDLNSAYAYVLVWRDAIVIKGEEADSPLLAKSGFAGEVARLACEALLWWTDLDGNDYRSAQSRATRASSYLTT